jgi:hypothetical protein
VWLVLLLAQLRAGAGGAADRFLIDGTINGKPVRFAFDTGASDRILFSQSAQRLGVSFTPAKADAKPSPGKVAVGLSETCDLGLGPHKARIDFFVIDLPPMLPPDVDGLLGWGSLKLAVFAIDARRMKIDDAEVPKDLAGWTKLKLVANAGVLLMEIPRAGGKPAVLLVDTGANGGVELAPSEWAEWKATHPKQPMTLNSYFQPGVGLKIPEEAWASELPLGPLMLTDVPVRGADRIVARDMMMGMAALRRLEVIVDGPGGYAYLRPSSTPGQAYDHNRLGAVFAPANLTLSNSEKDQDLVAFVMAGTPAAEAGIRKGDVLLKIDALDVTKWQTDPTVFPLSRFWERPPGTQFELTLRRGEEILKVKVTLRQILGPEKSAGEKEAR